MQLEQPPETAHSDGTHSIKLSEGYNPITTTTTTNINTTNMNDNTTSISKISYQNRHHHNIRQNNADDESVGQNINDNPRESLIKGEDGYITLPIG